MALNIICLHGFTQNNDVFEKKLSKLTKSIKGINLYFLEGSVDLMPVNNTPVLSKEEDIGAISTGCNRQKAYWIYNKENPINADWTDHYKPGTKIFHLEDSLEEFIKLGKKIGGIDGIIGFSQGGCFTDYICKMHAQGKIPFDTKFDIKFAVFIAAEEFSRPDCDFADVKPKISTLHMFGAVDTIIPLKMSSQLAKSYPISQTFIHTGAHVVPSNSAAKIAFKNLLASIK